MGEVLLIECNGLLAGYSIIFRFWNNEYAGLLTGIDELFIKKEFRHLGVATTFTNKLINDIKKNPVFVGVELESHPGNETAGKFFFILKVC